MKGNFEKKIKALRKQIDKIDNNLIRGLSSRMAVSRKMGRLKYSYGVPIIQKARWKSVIATRLKKAKRHGLDAKIVNKIFKEIHKASIQVQRKVSK